MDPSRARQQASGFDTDWNLRMREDWDARARQDPEHFIYTHDRAGDNPDFVRSGEANYNQLVRPFLPILLSGRPARDSRIVEIGCGIGRMTEWFARDFARVDALDVSPVMIEGARQRLGHLANIAFHTGSGSDLASIPSESADLVFTYIVFQHIPSREAIESYIAEAVRVLKPGGVFKFQLNSYASPIAGTDTWFGAAFTQPEISDSLRRNGLRAISREGIATQYCIVTARKGIPTKARSYILPGEPWSSRYLLEGFGPPVEDSWRRLSAGARVCLQGSGTRLYMGIHFWPDSYRHRVTMAGHSFEIDAPGDHYLECTGAPGEIVIDTTPEPASLPAFRVIGLY